MSKPSALLLRLGLAALLVSPLAAQQLRHAPVDFRALDGGELAALRLASGEAMALSLPARVLAPVEIAARIDGADRVLRVWSHSMRAPDFRLLVANAAGQIVEQVPAPVTTIRGEVVGLPGSVVAGSLVDGRLDAAVRLAPDSEPWMIQPLAVDGSTGVIGSRSGRTAVDGSTGANGANSGSAASDGSTGTIGATPGPVEHAVYAASASVSEGEICGSDVVPTPLPSHFVPATSGATATKICELALEADFPFFQANGNSVNDTQADMEAIINAVEAIYLVDVGITYSITSNLIHAATDPYTTLDPEPLLIQFRNEFGATQGGVVRDTAHLFTGRNMTGSVVGIAYVAVICNSVSGFGLSQSLFTNSLAGRVALTAHEIGHNWSAGHCNGDPDCAIMCAGLGGCTGIVSSFGSASIANIENHKANVNCLDFAAPDPDGGPLLFDMSPDFGPENGGGPVAVNGFGFLDDPGTSVLFGGVPGQIQSIVEDTIVVLPPAGLAGERVDVTVADTSGSTVLADGFGYEWNLVPGDSATSSLTTPNDIDRGYFVAAAGSLLTLNLRRKGPGGAALVPGLRLLGPGEEEVAVVEDDPADPSGRARLLKFELPSSGTYRLELYGVDGTVGTYRLRTKLKPVRKLKQTLAVAPSMPEPFVAFEVLAGTKLTRLVFKARPAKGEFQTIEGQPSAVKPTIVLVQGPGGPIDVTELVTVSPNEKKLKLEGLILDELGKYAITLGGAQGSVGFGKLTIKLKPPKLTKVSHQADPDLE